MELKKKFPRDNLILFIGLIMIGILGRYVLFGLGVQPFPNFEVIMVLTFLAVLFLHPAIAFLVPLISMMGSDLLIGNSVFVGHQMNQIVLFTYSGFMLIALINTIYREKLRSSMKTFTLRNVGLISGLGVGFVLLYDVWTNFGWWYLIYPHTLQSLGAVFIAGIPFMIYHLLSGLTTFLVIAVPILLIANQQSTKEGYEESSLQKLPVALATGLIIILSFIGIGW